MNSFIIHYLKARVLSCALGLFFVCKTLPVRLTGLIRGENHA